MGRNRGGGSGRNQGRNGRAAADRARGVAAEDRTFRELPASPFNYDAIEEWGDQHYNPAAWDADELEALQKYTTNEIFRDLNSGLRNDGALSGPLERYRQALDRFFAKPYARVPENIYAFRVLEDSVANAVRQAGVGSVITDKGFVSASLVAFRGSPSYARQHRIEIRVPQGSRGVYLGEKVSAHASEAELLLPRGSQFRVVGFEGNSIIVDLVTR